jgi:lipopolysaccharide export system permease protein
MRILDRLVAGTFSRLFVLSILATPPLFILGDVTENMDRYLDRGLTGAQVVLAYVWMLPLYVQWSFPIAALIAAVFTVHNMTIHHEVVAAKAGGISFHRLILPVLVGGGVLMIVALGLSALAPRAYRRANDVLQNQPSRPWRTDFVFQTDDGLALAVTRMTLDDNTMIGLMAMQRGKDGRPRIHVEAESAGYTDGEGWTFHGGDLRLIEAPDTLRSFHFSRLRIAGLNESPSDLLEEPREEEEMTYRELGKLARVIEQSGGQANKLLVKRGQKISLPVATLIIILFGTPLATSARRGGGAYGIGVSLGSTMLYLLLLKISAGFGAGNALPPLWAAWLPNIIFLVVGLVLLRRVRT